MLVRLGQRRRTGLTVPSLARIGQLQAEVRGHRVNHDTFMMRFLNGSGFFSLDRPGPIQTVSRGAARGRLWCSEWTHGQKAAQPPSPQTEPPREDLRNRASGHRTDRKFCLFAR